MVDYQLRTVREIREYAEKTWSEKFDSDEDAYVDAMSNGEYHEERTGLACLAGKIEADDVVRLFVPVAWSLVRCSVNNRQGDPGLSVLMSAHEALVRWSRRQLAADDSLLDKLALVRGLISEELKRDKQFGWWQTLEQFHVVEACVHHAMGLRLYELESKYDSLVYDLQK